MWQTFPSKCKISEVTTFKASSDLVPVLGFAAVILSVPVLAVYWLMYPLS
jgi:hypothetical protein